MKSHVYSHQVAEQVQEAGLEVYDRTFRLSILALQGSVQQSWVQEFGELVGTRNSVKLKNKPQLRDLFKSLESGDVGGADLVSLGDGWLSLSIQQRLIRPFSKAKQFRFVLFLMRK